MRMGSDIAFVSLQTNVIMAAVRKKLPVADRKPRAQMHSIRLNESVWNKWNHLKDETKQQTHNDFALKVLNQWEISIAQADVTLTPPRHTLPTVLFDSPDPGTSTQTRPAFEASDVSEGEMDQAYKNIPETPQRHHPIVLFSTPDRSGVARPTIEASEISAGSESDQSADSLLQRYQLKAKEADNSIINITYEISENEDVKKDKSYHPDPLSDDDFDDDYEESDTDEYDDDFCLDMTLRQDDIIVDDINAIPIHSVAERFIDLSSDESDNNEDEVCQLETTRNVVEECKSVCFETELRQLASMKPITTCTREDCHAATSVSVKYIGTSVQLKWVCSNNHDVRRWDSQPLIKRVKAGDFILSSAILCSGNNFSKVQLLFKFCSLAMLSQATHNQIQGKHTAPVVERHFTEMISNNLEKYRGKEICVAGDGRMDSPGFCAQYCTYTLLEYNTKDIVACEIIDKRMTAMKSTYMEKEGLQRAMRNLMDNGVVIKELCTDASTSIAAMIRKDHPAILHTYDTWHGAKNFGKKLGSVAAESKNKELRPWVPDIINHFWYCSKTANGSKDVLLARWRGALHHVTDVHEWVTGDNAIEPKCDHEPITEDKEWLEAGGNSHSALTRVMLDPRFLGNLKHFANFRHTGELETFHEHILMYAAKRFAYRYPAYKARNYLAALDYTEHQDRAVMFNKDGQPRLHRCYSKRNGNWTCYQEKEPKKYKHVGEIMKDTIYSYRSSKLSLRARTELEQSDPRRIKRHLSTNSPPSTKHLMSVKKTRF